MSGKHRKTLQDIFSFPVSTNIQWRDVEQMLIALGAQISEGNGSRVRMSLNGVKAVFHRPHPRKETDKGAVVLLRRFLITANISPADNSL
jgi:hypothetical protein